MIVSIHVIHLARQGCHNLQHPSALLGIGLNWLAYCYITPVDSLPLVALVACLVYYSVVGELGIALRNLSLLPPFWSFSVVDFCPVFNSVTNPVQCSDCSQWSKMSAHGEVDSVSFWFYNRFWSSEVEITFYVATSTLWVCAYSPKRKSPGSTKCPWNQEGKKEYRSEANRTQ